MTLSPTEPAAMSGPSEDAARLRELYDRYAPGVFRLAYRLTGSRADAEDVVQDVFVGLPTALRSYTDRGRLGGWIHKIAARVALSSNRRRARRREIPMDDADEWRVSAGSVPGVDGVALDRALRLLPETLRAVVVLKEVEGHTHAEIARLLGIREGTSQVRLHRAHQKLHELLGGEP